MIASELVEKFKSGEKDNILLEIYGEQSLLSGQRVRYQAAIENFIRLFGDMEVQIYSAPGRTEIGGNHTDHQHGQVLAAAVNVDIIAVAARTGKSNIRIVSKQQEICNCDVDELLGTKADEGSSISLVQGMACELQKQGVRIEGFCAYMTSEVLVGSGLSSSAAFENVVGCMIAGMDHKQIEPVTLAKLSQLAENQYFGKPCGLMDQMASSIGNLVHIDFMDITNPKIEVVTADLSESGYVLCIIDTKGSHVDLTPEYAAIPEEMKKVAAVFGKQLLCEVGERDFYENIGKVREKAGDRAVLRAFHYFEENKRVEKETDALKQGQIKEFLSLVAKSGDSSYKYLQNIYSNRDVQTQNLSLALALSEKYLGCGKGVARVHGGGFAGTIQCFVKKEDVKAFQSYMDNMLGTDCCQVLYIRKKGTCRVL